MRFPDAPRLASVAAAMVLAAQPALAEGLADIGTPAAANKADRTVEVVMNDNYFSLDTLTVRSGETIRFIIRNEGAFLHEFALGTPEMHAAHQKDMAVMQQHGMLTATSMDHDMKGMDHSGMGMADMDHGAPSSVLVEPGKTNELVWTFKQPMALEFACNVPGHYETGMVGTLIVAPETKG